MHILIVDDYDLFREGLVKILQECFHGVTISEAYSVASATTITQQHHQSFDLVLLDHELPDGLGVDLLAEFRHEYPHLTVAILSAWEDSELMQHALQLGALGYIPKNTPMPVMLGAIQLILAGGLYIPPNLFSFLPEGLSKAKPQVRKKGRLTERQIEVLTLLRAGLSNKMIARELSISEATVKAHVTIILRSCGVSSRTQLLTEKKESHTR